MKAPHERDRGPHTTTTASVTHEHVVTWLDPIENSSAPDEFRPGRGRRPPTAAIDLVPLVEQLAGELGLPRPTATRWADMPGSWGRCLDGVVLISTAALELPLWVLKGIIAHELAHLVAPGHGPKFKAAVNLYPLAREVDGYLACVQDRDWGVHVVPHLHNPNQESP